MKPSLSETWMKKQRNWFRPRMNALCKPLILVGLQASCSFILQKAVPFSKPAFSYTYSSLSFYGQEGHETPTWALMSANKCSDFFGNQCCANWVCPLESTDMRGRWAEEYCFLFQACVQGQYELSVPMLKLMWVKTFERYSLSSACCAHNPPFFLCFSISMGLACLAFLTLPVNYS